MMYISYMQKGDTESARNRLNAAVTCMDVLVELNKTYREDNTKTFCNIPEEIIEKPKQFWKRSA